MSDFAVFRYDEEVFFFDFGVHIVQKVEVLSVFKVQQKQVLIHEIRIACLFILFLVLVEHVS